MILFVFEGQRSEPKLFETLKELFFPKRVDQFVCTYNSNIYSLYSHLAELDVFQDENVKSSGRTVSILNTILQKKGDDTLANILEAEISEIFLFFDYDFHESRLSLEENNDHLNAMLEYFNDETGNGKLYINYPMIESIKYHKELPDANFVNYTIPRIDCKRFKNTAHEFSYYKSLEYILIPHNPNENIKKQILRIGIAKENWKHLIDMNVSKANYICNSSASYPGKKSDIQQSRIFSNQLLKYVDTEQCCVAILNAFPLFIYDYFDMNKLFTRQNLNP